MANYVFVRAGTTSCVYSVLVLLEIPCTEKSEKRELFLFARGVDGRGDCSRDALLVDGGMEMTKFYCLEGHTGF